MTDPTKTNKLDNYPQWEKIAGFAFGVLFLGALLLITFLSPDPTHQQYVIYKTILAVATAGLAGIFTGFLNINGKMKKMSVRASGAFAIFCIIFIYEPASNTPTTISTGNITVTSESGTAIGLIGPGAEVTLTNNELEEDTNNNSLKQ